MGESIRELLERPVGKRHARRGQHAERAQSVLGGRRWTAQELRLFYRGLSLFGTDFMLIAHALPSKNRRQIVRKFHKEELSSPERVERALHKHRNSAQGLLARVLDQRSGEQPLAFEARASPRRDSFHSLESLDREIAHSLRAAIAPAPPSSL